MITACEEHVDMALDEFVDTYQEPPELRLIGEASVSGSPAAKCQFCGSPAKYLLARDAQ